MQKLLELLNKIFKYLIAAVILTVPLYPKFPAIMVPGTYVAVRLEDFLLLMVVFTFLLLNASKLKRFIKNDINRSILIYFLVGLVSLTSAVFLTQTVELHIGFLHWLRRVEYLALLLIGITVIKDTRSLDFYLKLFGIVIIAAFIYGLGQKYLTWPVIITQNLEYSKGIALRWIPGSHINSTFAGHYDLATFLVLLLPIFIGLFFTVKGARSKLFFLIVVISGLWLLVNAISRISVVSYLLGVSVTLLLLRKYKAIPVVLALSIMFFSLSTDLISRYTRILDITKTRIEQQINKIILRKNYSFLTVHAQEEEITQRRIREVIPTPSPTPVYEDRSTSIRLNVEWPRALRAFYKNPFLGTGYSSITLATDNDYLRLLGETGLLGFFSFFLIFARLSKIFKSSIKLLSKKILNLPYGFLAGVLGAMPGIFLNAVFIDIFEASKFVIIFWLVIGIFVSTVKLINNEDNY